METITSKKEIQSITGELALLYQKADLKSFINSMHEKILRKKVRFPLLEFCAKELMKIISEEEQVKAAHEIMKLHEIGGNVFAGIFLQLRLKNHFQESIQKAAEFMVLGDEWYVCDIIGERVMGYALLTQPEKTLPVLKKLSKDPEAWVVRSVGVGGHYAIKKGLKKKYVEEYFQLLLTQKNAENFHVKRGIGWAAKTTAKFHPELITKYQNEIDGAGQWFKTKVDIGLGRSVKYGSRYLD